MKRIRAAKTCAYGAVFAAIPFLLQCAPAPPGTGRAPASPAARTPVARTASADTAKGREPAYRFEDELPEKTPAREAPLVERIEPLAADTFSVEEGAVEEKPAPAGEPARETQPKQLFSIGYRIQVYASADRSAAERMQKRVAAEAKMPAYIDFEDGLYKVRAGDFAERKDAAQAKLSMEKLFPGCWIVRTTIRAE